MKTVSQMVAKNIEFIAKTHELPAKTISDIEKAAGLSKGYISRCRSGKRRLSIDAVVAVSNYLNISIETLLKRDYELIYKEAMDEARKKFEYACSQV